MLVIKEKVAYHIKNVFSLEGKNLRLQHCCTNHFSLREEIGVNVTS
jgi:hypothetical protein